MRRYKKEGSKKQPKTPSVPQQPAKRPPWDDGRCGGYVGPPPSQADDWYYNQWIKDTDR